MSADVSTQPNASRVCGVDSQAGLPSGPREAGRTRGRTLAACLAAAQVAATSLTPVVGWAVFQLRGVKPAWSGGTAVEHPEADLEPRLPSPQGCWCPYTSFLDMRPICLQCWEGIAIARPATCSPSNPVYRTKAGRHAAARG